MYLSPLFDWRTKAADKAVGRIHDFQLAFPWIYKLCEIWISSPQNGLFPRKYESRSISYSSSMGSYFGFYLVKTLNQTNSILQEDRPTCSDCINSLFCHSIPHQIVETPTTTRAQRSTHTGLSMATKQSTTVLKVMIISWEMRKEHAGLMEHGAETHQFAKRLPAVRLRF